MRNILEDYFKVFKKKATIQEGKNMKIQLYNLLNY